MAKNLSEMMNRAKVDEVFRNFDGIKDGGSFEKTLKYVRLSPWKLKAAEERSGDDFDKLVAEESEITNRYNSKMTQVNDYDGFDSPRIDSIYTLANCRTIDNSNVPYYYFDAIRKEFVRWYANIKYKQDVNVIFKDNQFKSVEYIPSRSREVKFACYTVLDVDASLIVEVDKVAKGRRIPIRELIKLNNWHTSYNTEFKKAVDFLKAWMEYMLIEDMYQRYRMNHKPNEHSVIFPAEIEFLVEGARYLMYYGVSEGVIRADFDDAFKEVKYLADCEKSIVISDNNIGNNDYNNFELLAWVYSYFINKDIVHEASPAGFER